MWNVNILFGEFYDFIFFKENPTLYSIFFKMKPSRPKI